jgi:PhnB protein
MAKHAKPIPDGYHSVTPYLHIAGAAAAIEFYKQALGAVEIMRMTGDDGRIGHAELQIGDSRIMLADEHAEIQAYSPKHFGGSPITLMLYCEDVDATVAKAVAEGAKITRPIADQFYGDRNGGIEDPFGYQWFIATHVEDVSNEQIERRTQTYKVS